MSKEERFQKEIEEIESTLLNVGFRLSSLENTILAETCKNKKLGFIQTAQKLGDYYEKLREANNCIANALLFLAEIE